MPFISIIMPIYNVEKYLEETINSIINQTFSQWELICVDDGSWDNSGMICEAFAQKDSRIRVIHQENQGAAVARNSGLCFAEGEYVIFLDADDVFYPELLEAMYVSAVDNQSELVVVGSEWFIEDGENRRVVHRTDFSSVLKEKDRHYFDAITTVPWNKLVNRKWMLKNNIRFQEIPTNNDVFFSLTVIMEAQRCSFVDKRLIGYRYERKDSLTARRSKGETYILDAYEAVICRIGERGGLQAEYVYELVNYMLFSLKSYLTENIYSSDYRFKMKMALASKEKFYGKIADAHENAKLSSANEVLWRFITDTDAVLLEECDLYRETLYQILNEYADKKIAVWGCGKIGKQVIDAINKMNRKIDYVIDSNIELHGKEYGNYTITSLESVKDVIDVVIVSGIGIYQDVYKKCMDKVVIDIYKRVNSK